MATSRVEYEFDDGLHADRMAAGLAPDLGRVLVVGMSQINRIVVSKIVERSGLKPVSETPQSAIRVLPLVFPGLIVLDGGPDNHDCDVLAPGIMALRRISSRDIPAVILLPTGPAPSSACRWWGRSNAVVPKPFTTDQLQPVVDRLLDKARG